MYCPNCHTPNGYEAAVCERCKADLQGLSERVSVGNQFVFIDASARRPVALSLDQDEVQTLTQPTIVSRHRHGIGLGLWQNQPRRSKAAETHPAPTLDLPRLPAPAGPDLTAVITERKIYRPKEEAHIFIVAPDLPGQEIEMEVHLSGQQITKERVTLDHAGLALRPFSDLEEGEYAVKVRRPGRDKPAQCTFSVAEFSLSALIALLERHTYEAGTLSFRLRIVALSVPYSGPLELALQSGDHVVEAKTARASDGIVEGSFYVKDQEGPFRVQVTTPDGEAATVFFPGTGKTERERMTLCPLGRVAEAGLLPGEDTAEVRGLHIGYDGYENTPLRLESAVGPVGRLACDIAAAAVQVVVFHPLTGDSKVFNLAAKPGDTIEFPVWAPYSLFTVGAAAPRQAYEAWGIIVHPVDLQASLLAPERAEPGEAITVRVETTAPAACLLLVYDARLEHESPVPKLAKQMMDAMRAATAGLRERTAPSLAARPIAPWYYAATEVGLGARSMAPPPSGPTMLFMPRETAVRESPKGTLPVPLMQAVETAEPEVSFVTIPSREDFPELAYLELFSVDGWAERTVPLGDQIGTWRCRAYLVAGLDVQELTADLQAEKAVYAELDLPAIVGEGDDILAGVKYHTQQPATMTITLPDGQMITGAVMGHGSELFHLTRPGTVGVHITSAEGEDWTSREVGAPGVQTVTASRLDLLRRGESIQAERIVVFPGPAEVLKETIEALGRYPFG